MPHYPSNEKDISLYIKLNAERMIYHNKVKKGTILAKEEALKLSKNQYVHDVKIGKPRFTLEELLMSDQEIYDQYKYKNKRRLKVFFHNFKKNKFVNTNLNS
jgi:hypothetical protein